MVFDATGDSLEFFALIHMKYNCWETFAQALWLDCSLNYLNLNQAILCSQWAKGPLDTDCHVSHHGGRRLHCAIVASSLSSRIRVLCSDMLTRFFQQPAAGLALNLTGEPTILYILHVGRMLNVSIPPYNIKYTTSFSLKLLNLWLQIIRYTSKVHQYQLSVSKLGFGWRPDLSTTHCWVTDVKY